MAVQKQDDQHEHTFSNYVRIRDVIQKTSLRRWTIWKSGERGSGLSVLPARHDYYYYYYYYYLLLYSFSHRCQLMVFHWSLSDSKSPQVSRTRLSMLAVLSNVVVWIVSSRLPISNSSRPFNSPLVIVPNIPITIGTIVTFMFHRFFNSLARSRNLFFFSLSFRFIPWSAGTAKSTILQILFLFLIIMRSGLLAGIRWSVCMLKSHRSLCETFFRTGTGLWIYHLFLSSNWNFLLLLLLFTH